MKLSQQIKFVGKEIIHNSPLLREIYLRKRFARERMLFNGCETANSHQSVLFFTLHKCASVYAKEILKEISQDTDITSIELDNYLLMSELPSLNSIVDHQDISLQREIKDLFKPKGYLYTTLRYPKILDFIDNLDAYKILLLLRDPRDVLTSAYYSFGYTHTLPITKVKRDSFLAWRDNVASLTLDEFILSVKDDWLKIYTYYCQNLVGKPNVLLVKFEDMTGNFDSWLNDIIKFIDLNIEPKKVLKIVSTANQKKIKPTDHRKVLQPDTIDILNREFCEVLDFLGYN